MISHICKGSQAFANIKSLKCVFSIGSVIINPTDIFINSTSYTACSFSPTLLPSVAPTLIPTTAPTSLPTITPTVLPTIAPTLLPSYNPTLLPTIAPTILPTVTPTVLPTVAPSLTPSVAPTLLPTTAPTLLPTIVSTSVPTLPQCPATPGPLFIPSTTVSLLSNDYSGCKTVTSIIIPSSLILIGIIINIIIT